ncbi:hypothetical protein TI05_13470 [Achromatium sp. WMS3]|nr:hypothetical protein TI05_13470 [Achromatium sp. WMS3]
MEFVMIPGGCFMMGSPASEQGRNDDEKQHRVCVHEGGSFWMGKYEVTQEQWRKVMNNNPSYFQSQGAKRPVERVYWINIQNFISKLNEQTGKKYRLPTEAEWEYAARGGTSTRYWWGDQAPVCRKGARNEANCNTSLCRPSGTVPVGSYQANQYGLYDVVGNVYEFTCSAYQRNYNGAEKKCAPGNFRKEVVMRGGSWKSSATVVRAAFRHRVYPANLNKEFGFRLVLDQ